MSDIFIIAEAGVNHNGDVDLAFSLIDAAASAGADAVKFQTFKAENLVTKDAVKADYQQHTTDEDESQFAMLKRLELSQDDFRELMEYCKKKDIEFLSTAFDMDSLNFLVNDLGLKTLKIPSGEITNGPLILAHARTGCDLIVSTGMATLKEVDEALAVISFGLVHGDDFSVQPSRKSFQEARTSSVGHQLLKQKVILLHCTTEYPAPLEDINLNAMQTMRKEFGVRVGYSDHSEGIIVPVAAAALGAVLVEKHFTLDKNMSGPDHKASLEPDDLKEMVTAIRAVELVLGDGLKVPKLSELSNRDAARKSLVAADEIKKGDLFSEENIAIKRPGTGISPMKYWDSLGEESQHAFKLDEVIR